MKSGARSAGRAQTSGRGAALAGARFGTRLLELDAPAAAIIGATIVVLLGVPLAFRLSIWIDEAFTLHTTGSGALEAWARTIAFEAQPPLYFFLVALVRSVDEASIAVGRLPSVAFAAAAVAVIVFAARRIVPRVPPLVTALVTALNPLVIWAATEMRVYALVLLIGAVLTWTFYEAFVVTNRAPRALAWYTAAAIAGMYTQYYVAFVLVAHGVTVLLLRRAALRAFILSGVGISAAFAPFAGIALMHARASGEFVMHISALEALHEVADTVFTVVLPHDLTWSGPVKLVGFAVASALVAVLAGIGRPTVPSGPARAVVVQWFVYLIVLCALLAVGGAPFAPAKYLIAIAPSSLLVALLFVVSRQRIGGRLGAAAAAVYAVYAVSTLAVTYRPPFEKPGEWRRVAATVQADGGSMPVVVFPSELAEPLRWYDRGHLLALPGPMPYTLDYVERMTLRGESDVARVLDSTGDPTGRLWVVTTGDCGQRLADIYDYHCAYLEAYLDRRYRLIRTVPFRGSSARLYSRLP